MTHADQAAAHAYLLSRAVIALRVGEPDLAYHLVVSSMKAGQAIHAADKNFEIEARARIMRISLHELIVLATLRRDYQATLERLRAEEKRLGYASWAKA